MDSNSLWYKDGIIYQIHIKSYNDSNNDGIGDFRGLINRLDYIQELGVNIIWLLPFYPSPLKDDGYDTADYMNVNSDYGTIDEFKHFLEEAHNRGLKVVTELVLNHTSDQHKWFKLARRGREPYRDYYVWSNTTDKYKDARIIFQDFELSNWTYDPVAKAYFWHRFYSHQPDLNFDNPAVHEEFFKIVDYWFGLGVDGLRLDAVPYLYEREGTNCENLPETHEFLKKLNAHIQQKFPDRMLLAEANQWPEDAVQYFGNGDECQMAFHFPVMPRLYMAVQMENRYPIVEILEQTPSIPENCQWAMFLRNHDELTLEMVTDEERDFMYRAYVKDSRARINLGIRRRLAPLTGNNRRLIELLNILLFSFPGTPIIYYGDEIGMGDNYYLGDRDGVRTPMQWSADRNAGFSGTNPQRLILPVIIDPEFHYESVNVEVQQRSSASLWWWMKKALAIRKKSKALGRGSLEFLTPENPKILAFIRKYEEEIFLIVVNLSKFPQYSELELSNFNDYKLKEVFSKNYFAEVRDSKVSISLNAYDYYWFHLEQPKEVSLSASETYSFFSPAKIEDILSLHNAEIENMVLLNLHQKVKNRISEISIVDYFVVEREISAIVLYEVTFYDSESEIHIISFSISPTLHHENKEIFAVIKDNDNEFYLQRGIYSSDFRRAFFESLFIKKYLKGTKDNITFNFDQSIIKEYASYSESSKINSITSEYATINYFDKVLVKIYSKPEPGLHPEFEIYSKLKNLDYMLPYIGKIEYNKLSLGIVTETRSNAGNAFMFFSEGASSFIDDCISKDNVKVDTIYVGLAELLGERLAQFHISVSTLDEEDHFFKPEEFSMLYQRAIYQSLLNNINSVFRKFQKVHDPLINNLKELIANRKDDLKNMLVDVLRKKIDSKKIRIHNNLHLGQVLFTGKDFIFTNFEGNPYYPVSERRIKRSPLRDLGSLLWSVHFASYIIMDRFPSDGFNENIENYKSCISEEIVKGYFKTIKGANLIPEDFDEVKYLVRLYYIDKIFSELNYDLENDIEASKIALLGLKQFLI